jgi:hypothetical protein
LDLVFFRGAWQISQALQICNEFALYSPSQAVLFPADRFCSQLVCQGHQAAGNALDINTVDELCSFRVIVLLIAYYRLAGDFEDLCNLLLCISLEPQVGNAHPASRNGYCLRIN